MKFVKNVKLDPSQIDDRRGQKNKPDPRQNPIVIGARVSSATPRYRPAPSAAVAPKGGKSPIQMGVDLVRQRVAEKKRMAERGAAPRLPFGIRPQVFPAAALPPVEEAYAPQDFTSLLVGALGGPPDAASYTQPFDEAEARSRQALADALPSIANAYAKLKTDLNAGQSEFATTQARLAAEQTARAAQAKEQTEQLQSPVLGDLSAMFGPDALGSLNGATAASAAQVQANQANQAQQQQGLASELAAQQARSHQSRLADADVAREGAVSSAKFNLNDILAQLGVQKAAAQRQYAGDVTDYNMRSASAQMEGARAARSDAKETAADPGKELALALKQINLQKALKSLEPKGQKRAALQQHLDAVKPGKDKAKTLFERILTESPDKKTAYSGLAAFAAGNDAFGNAKKPGTFMGARINPTVIRGWIDDWFDES